MANTAFTFETLNAALAQAEQSTQDSLHAFKAKTVLLEGNVLPWNYTRKFDKREGTYPATTKDGEDHPFAGKAWTEARVKFHALDFIEEVPEQLTALTALRTVNKQDLVLRMTFIQDDERESGLTQFSSRVNLPIMTGQQKGLCRVRGTVSFNVRVAPLADIDEHGHASDLSRAEWINNIAPEDLDASVPEGKGLIRVMAEVRVRSLYQKPRNADQQVQEDHDDLPPMEQTPETPDVPKIDFASDPLAGV